MKKDATIKNLFGLTQEEMAMILGITRVQWAMYEIRKRDLPSAANIKFATALSHLHNVKVPSNESQRLLKEEQEKKQEWLKRKKSNLEYKKLLLEQKIIAMESKRTQSYAALEVVNYLEAEQLSVPSLAEGIATRVKSTLRKNSLQHLEELNLKREHLTHIIKSVEEKMNQYQK